MKKKIGPRGYIKHNELSKRKIIRYVIYTTSVLCATKKLSPFPLIRIRGVVAGREAETCGRKRRVYMTKCVWDDFTANMEG